MSNFECFYSLIWKIQLTLIRTKLLAYTTNFKEKEKEEGGKAWKKKWNWKKEKWEQEGEQRAGNLTRLPYESKKACGIFSDHHHWLL